MKIPKRYRDLGVKLTYRSIDPQWLCNDRTHYQRDLSWERVQKARREAPRALLVAYHVLEDTYWVIDGQHHATAALVDDVDLVDCWVFMSTGWLKDREVFNKFQEGN